MDKPKDRPSIGRIVHYVAAGMEEHIPGVITKVFSDERVNIHLWWDPTTIRRYDQERVGGGCDHDEGSKEVGSWHWPERM